MFSRDFARSRTWHVHPTVDLALNFHKKIPLYSPSSLNISEGGSLLSFCTVLAYLNFIFKAFLALPKTASSAQTHKSVSSFELFGALYMYIAVSSTKAFTESK